MNTGRVHGPCTLSLRIEFPGSLFFLFSLFFSSFRLFFSFFFFFLQEKVSSLLGQREIHPFHKREEEEEEGEGRGGGEFSIAFPFRSTIWRGKVRKNGCDGGDGTSSVEIPRSPPRPRGTSTTRYVQEEDIARKVERERERESYVRWLSTPVIKYGASKGSQHGRASLPSEYASPLFVPPLLHRVIFVFASNETLSRLFRASCTELYKLSPKIVTVNRR